MSTLSERAENAQNHYEAEHAKLLREDGTRRFSDKEHAERDAALRADLGGTLDAVETSADEETSRAEATLAKYFDRSALLSAEELAAAGARRVFVSEDADRLPLDELASRLEALLKEASDAGAPDRASAFLYARYAHARAERERATAPGIEFTDSYERLEAALGRLEEGLQTGEERAARRAIEEAQEVKSTLSLRRRGARTPLELYRLRRYAS